MRKRKSVEGFSLTELAIVLAVIGIMVGGLWTIFGNTSESADQNQLSQDITAVVSNVRAAYQNRIAISGTTQTIMASLEAMKTIFPGDMTSSVGGKPSSPWGGASLGGGAFSTFNVCMWNTACVQPACTCPLDNATNAALSSPLFAINIQNLSRASCMAAATRDSNSSMPAGLVDVYVNGASVGIGAGAMPVRASAVETPCNNASNIVDFVYRLNPATAP